VSWIGPSLYCGLKELRSGGGFFISMCARAGAARAARVTKPANLANDIMDVVLVEFKTRLSETGGKEKKKRR